MENSAEIRVVYADATLTFSSVQRIIVCRGRGGERELPREEWGTHPIGEFSALHIQTPQGFSTVFPDGVRAVRVRG